MARKRKPTTMGRRVKLWECRLTTRQNSSWRAVTYGEMLAGLLTDGYSRTAAQAIGVMMSGGIVTSHGARYRFRSEADRRRELAG